MNPRFKHIPFNGIMGDRGILRRSPKAMRPSTINEAGGNLGRTAGAARLIWCGKACDFNPDIEHEEVRDDDLN